MTDHAEKRGQLIRHLEDALADDAFLHVLVVIDAPQQQMKSPSVADRAIGGASSTGVIVRPVRVALCLGAAKATVRGGP
jgi:hypothetical protein